MKSKARIFFIIFFFSLVASIVISPLRGGYVTIGPLTGFYLSSIVGLLTFFSLTIWTLSKYRCKLSSIYIITALFLGLSILIAPLHIVDFVSTLGSFLEYLIQVFAIILGCIVHLCKLKKTRIIISIAGIAFGLWLSYPGYEMWLNKVSHGTFTGQINNSKIYDFQFQTAEGDEVSLKTFEGKYLLIDHWYTYCGVCYRKFPKVQEVFDKYKDNPNVSIIAIHSRLEDKEETYSTGKKILEGEGYSFPCYSINMKNPILKDLDVNGYPTVLIFDPESKLVFRGSIDFAEKYLKTIFEK